MKQIIIPFFLTITISLSIVAMENMNKKKTYTVEEMRRLSFTKISKKNLPSGANKACLKRIRNNSRKTLTCKTCQKEQRPSLNVKNNPVIFEKNNPVIFDKLRGPSASILGMIEDN